MKSVSAETVNLKVNAPLSVLNRLKEANMSVSLDVSRLSAVGEYPVGYTINYPNNVNVDEVEVNERIPNEITVTIDKLASETFEIEPRLEGSIAD